MRWFACDLYVMGIGLVVNKSRHKVKYCHIKNERYVIFMSWKCVYVPEQTSHWRWLLPLRSWSDVAFDARRQVLIPRNCRNEPFDFQGWKSTLRSPGQSSVLNSEQLFKSRITRTITTIPKRFLPPKFYLFMHNDLIIYMKTCTIKIHHAMYGPKHGKAFIQVFTIYTLL